MNTHGPASELIVQIPIEMAAYDVIDDDLCGAEEERHHRSLNPQRCPNTPFSKIAGEIPRVRDLGRVNARTKTYRQLWFEKYVLDRISEAIGSREIPYRFRTPGGEAWQLDQGNVGRAMANGKLVEPRNPNQRLDYVLIRQQSYDADANDEVERWRQLGIIASRPQQKTFSESIRRNYQGRRAITGCATESALHAAHIRVDKDSRSDYNSSDNGILLRSDIHALFDAYLITLAPSGDRLEISPELNDPTYDFLQTVLIDPPLTGPAPSSTNIADHRGRFRKEEAKCQRARGCAAS
jgi:hypothetical protein